MVKDEGAFRCSPGPDDVSRRGPLHRSQTVGGVTAPGVCMSDMHAPNNNAKSRTPISAGGVQKETTDVVAVGEESTPAAGAMESGAATDAGEEPESEDVLPGGTIIPPGIGASWPPPLLPKAFHAELYWDAASSLRRSGGTDRWMFDVVRFAALFALLRDRWGRELELDLHADEDGHQLPRFFSATTPCWDFDIQGRAEEKKHGS